MSDKPEQSAEFLLGRLANEQETNRNLRALLARAADALEDDESFVPATELEHWLAATEPLIAELRKAAE